jgi:hypothetical protein
MIIYKAGYSSFWKEQEVQTTVGFFKRKLDAQNRIDHHEKFYENDKKNLADKREYFIDEIEVK